MLFSISTGKSGSSWFDRLRSLKGFPVEDDLGLDHFLSNLPDSPVAATIPNQTPIPKETKINKECVESVTDILSQLFNVDRPNRSSSRLSIRRCSRKQTNPRFVTVDTANSNNSVEKKVAKSCGWLPEDENAMDSTAGNKEDEKAEEEGERELVGYSRSEVTVIDSSLEVWKLDKLVYRRKNVWKVRDRKGKSRFAPRKKRKNNVSDDMIPQGNIKKRKASGFGSQSLV